MKSRALALVLILVFSTVFAGAQYVEIDRAEVSEVQTLQSLASEKLFDVNFALVQIRSSVMATVYLNFTFLSKQTLPPDQGITEVYRVTIFTNGQVLGSIVMGRTIGVAPSMDYRVSESSLSGLSFSCSTVSSNEPELESYKIVLGPRPSLYDEPVTASLVKMGSILVNGTSTDGDIDGNEVIQEIPLEYINHQWVYTKLPESKPVFPTVLAVASIISVVVIGAGLLVYFKKHKHNTG